MLTTCKHLFFLMAQLGAKSKLESYMAAIVPEAYLGKRHANMQSLKISAAANAVI